MPSKIINYCKNENLEGLSRYLTCSNINQPDIWGKSPLYHAVRYGSAAAVTHIIDMGADIFHLNKIAGNKEDLLVTALRTSPEIVHTVSKHYGLHMNYHQHIKQHMNSYLPHLFRGNSDNLKVFLKGFKLYSLKGYESVFCKTAKKEHYQVLFDNSICFDLQSALRYTLQYHRYSSFILLLSAVRYSEQLDYVYRGPRGSQQTLLSICCSNGYYKGMQRLVDHGANIMVSSVNERNETRNNVMSAVDHHVTGKQYLSVVKCIKYLARLCPINDQNSRGQTALMFSERAGNTELSKLLIELGADINIMDMDKNKACDYVKECVRHKSPDLQ